MAEVVVIGAGVGGLAAAARLATLGHRVTVCEQAPEVGGKLARLERDGFAWDTGPSLLTMPQVLRELFEATGGPCGLDLVEVDPIASYRFADGTQLSAPRDDAAFERELDRALGPGAGEDWRRFAARAARVWDVVEQPFLRRTLDPAALARLSLRFGDLQAVAPFQTLRGLGKRYLRDARLRTFLERYATYTGSDPRRAPAALASVVHAERAFGAWYVRGGLRRIAEALAERAADRGATIRTGADVARVTSAGGRASGVVLADGQRLRADVVVANADAAHLYGELVDGGRGAAARRRLQRATPSLSGFVLLLGLRGRTPGLAHHTVLFGADYDAEFDALFGPRPRPVEDPTLYVSAPDDPALAPPGDESWFVLVNAPRQGQVGRGQVGRGQVGRSGAAQSGGATVDWRAPGLAEGYAQRLLDLLAARGLDVRDRIAAREIVTPADLADRTRAVGGAIYGTSSNGPRAAFLRPANRSPLPGLYLVGGSSHPGGGLPLVVLSAAIVADLVGRA